MVRTKQRMISYEDLKNALYLKGRVVEVVPMGNFELLITTAYDDNDSYSFNSDLDKLEKEWDELSTRIDLILGYNNDGN